MKVTTVAHSLFLPPSDISQTLFGERVNVDLTTEHATDIDLLHEFAGRACYQSYSLANPATAENDGYLGNIIDQGHYSVMEHGTVTFHVSGVSRALMLELERHRHISFSVESQRYVYTRKAHPEAVAPPAFNTILRKRLQDHYEDSLAEYDNAFILLREEGRSIKEAREAARAFLPNATPVDLLVSGNLRAWRDVLAKRWHTAADAEIRDFAGLILGELRDIAPFSVQDIPEEPYGGD